jgi:hypothetical protein
MSSKNIPSETQPTLLKLVTLSGKSLLAAAFSLLPIKEGQPQSPPVDSQVPVLELGTQNSPTPNFES